MKIINSADIHPFGGLNLIFHDFYLLSISSFFPLWNDYRQLNEVARVNAYTPVVIDLIDDCNQNAEVGENRPVDRVSGYTLCQIQSAFDVFVSVLTPAGGMPNPGHPRYIF